MGAISSSLLGTRSCLAIIMPPRIDILDSLRDPVCRSRLLLDARPLHLRKDAWTASYNTSLSLFYHSSNLIIAVLFYGSNPLALDETTHQPFPPPHYIRVPCAHRKPSQSD